MVRNVFTVLGLLGCVSALALPAAAQGSGPLVVRNDRAAAEAGTYWTSARLRSAKPLDLPRGTGGSTTDAIRMAGGPSESSAAGLPSYKGAALDVRLTEALNVLEAAEGGVAPEAIGTTGLRFTNERVVPMSTLRNTYPWKAVGKLFFTGATGGSFVCSASVVRNRVIATAGHCVYDTVVNRFHSNFFFVPGYDNGASPYGGFTWSLASTTGSWVAGNGSVPNAADFGVIVAANKVVSGQVRRIGDLTGWLGWKTNSLVGNNIAAMGYPCNLDACQILQRTSAHVLRARAEQRRDRLRPPGRRQRRPMGAGLGCRRRGPAGARAQRQHRGRHHVLRPGLADPALSRQLDPQRRVGGDLEHRLRPAGRLRLIGRHGSPSTRGGGRVAAPDGFPASCRARGRDSLCRQRVDRPGAGR